MIAAIQKAYYREARNPSDMSTLLALASEIGLDTVRFEQDMHSTAVQEQFMQDLQLQAELAVQGFPSLVLQRENRYYTLTSGYTKADVVLSRLQKAFAGI